MHNVGDRGTQRCLWVYFTWVKLAHRARLIILMNCPDFHFCPDELSADELSADELSPDELSPDELSGHRS